MNKKMKAKWIAALRSGKYQQTKDFLRTENGFCCLGVLCDISGEGVWVPDVGCEKYVVAETGKRSLPPNAVTDKYGIGHTGTLAGMNDSGSTFSEIADWIGSSL